MAGNDITLTGKQAAQMLGVSTRILKRIHAKGLLTATDSGTGKSGPAHRYHIPLVEVLNLQGKINPRDYRVSRKHTRRDFGGTHHRPLQALEAQVKALAAQVATLITQRG